MKDAFLVAIYTRPDLVRAFDKLARKRSLSLQHLAKDLINEGIRSKMANDPSFKADFNKFFPKKKPHA